MNSNQLQQGDVTLERVERIPDGARKVSPANGLYVLAYGEATGHKHAIQESDGIEMYEKGGRLYVHVVKNEAALTHEEHGRVAIPAGIWEVGGVIEYDHFAQEARRVHD